MITGRKCKLMVNGESFEAETLLASPDLRHLILSLNGGVLMWGNVLTRMGVRFDERCSTYRDVITGTPVEIDWLCRKCNEHFSGSEIFTLKGEMGFYVWNVAAARALVANPARREPSVDGKPQVVPPELLARMLDVNEEIVAEHLDHVDPSEPGIVAQRFGGMFLLDGTHRAHRCVRDGLPFRAHALTLPESESVLCRDLTEQSEVAAEVVARELRGVLRNNAPVVGTDGSITATLEHTPDEDMAAGEAAIRAHLSAEENSKVKFKFVPCKRG